MNGIAFDHQVLVEEFSPVNIVGLYTAYLGCGQKNVIGFFFFKKIKQYSINFSLLIRTKNKFLVHNKPLYILFLLLSILSCKKFQVPFSNCENCADQECEDFTWAGNISFEEYTMEGIQYMKPCFNPHNDQELIYVRFDPGIISNPHHELVIYNISDNSETILYDAGLVVGQPSWGASDKIVFSVHGNQLMMVNSDGSNLTQITSSSLEYFNPLFNINGNRFIAAGTVSSTNGSHFPIFNLSGEIVDSVKFKYGNNQIGYPFAFDDSFHEGYFNYANVDVIPNACSIMYKNQEEVLNELSPLEMIDGKGMMTSMCKVGNALFFVQHKKGLFKLNLASNKIEKIMTNCQSKYINSLSISADGQWLLYEQVTAKQTGIDQIIDEQSEIYKMNVFTHEKIKILGE